MENLFSVKNNIVLITGASAGIGKHFALTLAKYGANIILVGRNTERLNQTAQECQQYGVKTFAISADVKDSTGINKIIENSKKHFSHIDTLINAAGIAMRVPSLEITEQQWDDVMDINLKGTFLMSQAVAKWMIETKTAGKIINISSSAAFHTTTTRSVYSASKIGVESITRNLALNLAEHNIRVNCIAPGFFVTDLTRNYLKTDLGKSEIGMLPMRRAAEVKELEGTLLLLASDASSYMTASTIHIDGGYATAKV